MEIRALIADDDEGMRLILRKALERQGFVTVTKEVTSGQEAISAIEEDALMTKEKSKELEEKYYLF